MLYDLKHLVKERKRGLVAGSRARLEMFASVFTAWVGLHLNQPVLGTGRPRPTLRPGLDYISW